MQQYVIYVDDPRNRARIHKIECGRYVNRKEHILPDNRWLDGPYTLEEAKSVLQDLGKKDSECAKCCMR